MNQVWQIAKREIIQRGLNKATLATTIIMALVLGVGGIIAGNLLSSESEPDTIAVTADTQQMGTALKAVSKQMQEAGVGAMTDDAVTKRVASNEEAKKLVQKGDVDYAIVKAGEETQLLSDGPAPMSLSTTVRQIASSAALTKYIQDVGGNVQELNKQVNDVKFKAVNVSPKDEKDKDSDDSQLNDMANYIISLVALLLMFMIIMTAGQVVALGVVEEKSSRIVEVLLGAVSPTRLLLGKVLGVAIMALAQLAIMGLGAFIGGRALVQALDMHVDAAGISGWVLVWMVLGFCTYIFLYAGVGAMVTRTEDMGTALMPLVFLQMVILYVALFVAMRNPVSSIVRVLSFIPGASCYAMPVRIAWSVAPTWEILVAVALNLLALPLLIWLGGRAYRRGVMNTGGKLSFRQAFGRTVEKA